MIKSLLSIGIPAWIGMALGAAVVREIPKFWWVWAIGGIVLTVITTIFVYDRVNSRRSV